MRISGLGAPGESHAFRRGRPAREIKEQIGWLAESAGARSPQATFSP
jgi:hypothetical protein